MAKGRAATKRPKAKQRAVSRKKASRAPRRKGAGRKKGSPPKKGARKAATSSAGHTPELHEINQVVVWIVSGVPPDQVLAACASTLDLKSQAAEALISEARRRITIAADYTRDEEVGKAVLRLNEIFARATQRPCKECGVGRNPKIALAAQKELNRLLDLYPAPWGGPGEEGEGTPAQTETAAARAYLEPLGLGRKGDSLAELCRLAAQKLIEYQDAS